MTDTTLTAVPDLDPEATDEAPVEAPESHQNGSEGSKKSRVKKAAEKPEAGGEKVYASMAPAPFDPLGLDLDKKMGWDEWESLIRGLMTIEEGHNWWLGDAIAFGEEKFAEQAYQVFGDDTLKYDPKTLANYASVSRAVPKKVRRSDLSWSHHREVSALKDTRAQARLLNKAAKERLNCAELKLLVTAELPDNGTTGPEQKKRKAAYSINFSVGADQTRIGSTVAELAGKFVMDALGERGVSPSSFSIKGLPKVDEKPFSPEAPVDEEGWPVLDGEESDEV